MNTDWRRILIAADLHNNLLFAQYWVLFEGLEKFRDLGRFKRSNLNDELFKVMRWNPRNGLNQSIPGFWTLQPQLQHLQIAQLVQLK
jgi:hypothetical protein